MHGYETSGVHGALQFLEQQAERYLGRLNLIVAPCVSPWGYERIQRWNPDAIDPNRSFRDGGQSRGSRRADALGGPSASRTVLVHLDLHETTDSDLHEFDPARCARDGKPFERDTIPDGFYVIGNSEDPQAEFQKALITAVAPVTHIAPADAEGRPGRPAAAVAGVVWGESRSIGACAGFTDARFATDTPRSTRTARRTNPQECNDAQVAAVCAGLDFALATQ
ncbi:M14 family metallopeptidase [Stenotrophomonas sp. NRRL B-14846]|uniref:M14 family metallopeptidase n=1 Tax=Stenotrophomonas sp. NRRL B-14846 TaxID=3162882 RepID=UPI003D284545